MSGSRQVSRWLARNGKNAGVRRLDESFGKARPKGKGKHKGWCDLSQTTTGAQLSCPCGARRAEHGTPRSYNDYGCRCGACSEAQSAYRKEWYKLRKARDGGKVVFQPRERRTKDGEPVMEFGTGIYKDDGCDVSPSCLSCPLEVCKYE